MALATLHRLFRVLRVVPLALPPVVVLVLELDPAEVVDFLVDELLVAGGAVLRGLEEAFLEGVGTQRIVLETFRDGFFPYEGAAVKEKK